MQPPESIAVVDDHYLITEALAKIVREQTNYRFAGGFNSAAAFEDAVQQQGTPNFLLLDIHLGNTDGLTLCKQYRKRYPGMHIIMLTGLTQAAVVKNALRQGASGFMLKNMQQHELWECLEQVKRGDVYLHPEVVRVLYNMEQSNRMQPAGYLPRLSRREKEVLELIVAERTTQEIADALFITVNTVETHRSSLLLKLGARNTAGLVKITLEKGLLDAG